VQTIALGNPLVRRKLYAQYRKFRGLGFEVDGYSFGGRYDYINCVCRWEDEDENTPIMSGIKHYRTKTCSTAEAEAQNPHDPDKMKHEWAEWSAGFHHARRKSGETIEGDSSR
jgi:hypothetical protein